MQSGYLEFSIEFPLLSCPGRNAATERIWKSIHRIAPFLGLLEICASIDRLEGRFRLA